MTLLCSRINGTGYPELLFMQISTITLSLPDNVTTCCHIQVVAGIVQHFRKVLLYMASETLIVLIE